MLTYPITLRDVYGVDTPEEVIAECLTPEEAQKWEPTGKFRPTKETDTWVMPFVKGTATYRNDFPRLILRRRRVKRWRLAPGEQPRVIKVGDVVATDDSTPDRCPYLVPEGSMYSGLYGFVLEQYEEEA